MKKGKSLYSNCLWLQTRFTGEHGNAWCRARMDQLLNNHYSKTLTWFPVSLSLSSVKTSNKKKNRCAEWNEDIFSSQSNRCQRETWAQDPSDSLRTLLDNIVNRWQPDLMDEDQNSMESDLHSTLTPKRLKRVRTIYG